MANKCRVGHFSDIVEGSSFFLSFFFFGVCDVEITNKYYYWVCLCMCKHMAEANVANKCRVGHFSDIVEGSSFFLSFFFLGVCDVEITNKYCKTRQSKCRQNLKITSIVSSERTPSATYTNHEITVPKNDNNVHDNIQCYENLTV